ncbi:MAG: asparagine synthetase B, partial [Patescibacteria group bacterium]|nr:asparagine synthetase B [Patescibacteria group bacterium]
MCGITGGVWTDGGKALNAATLARMTDALAHRGPDGRGEFRSDVALHAGSNHAASDAAPGVALGHRRLAILDLPGGSQPMANEDETVWIVFNGEIYNFKPLRQKLEAAGHRFRTHSDTEVLVHLYEEHGPAMLDELVGMFSFALWDSRERR